MNEQEQRRLAYRKCLLGAIGAAVFFLCGWLALQRGPHQASTYGNAYYSLSLPENWEIQEEGMTALVLADGKEIASITAEENFQYGDSVEQITANWIGMHAAVKSQAAFWTDEKKAFQKVTLETELSPAQEMQGAEKEPDEIHYFYVSDEKLFVDILINAQESIPLLEQAIKTMVLP